MGKTPRKNGARWPSVEALVKSKGIRGATRKEIAEAAGVSLHYSGELTSNYMRCGALVSAGAQGRRRYFLDAETAAQAEPILAAEAEEVEKYQVLKRCRLANVEAVKAVMQTGKPQMAATIGAKIGLGRDTITRAMRYLMAKGEAFRCGIPSALHYATSKADADAFDAALLAERERKSAMTRKVSVGRKDGTRQRKRTSRALRNAGGRYPERPTLRLPEQIVKNIDGITLTSATAPAGRYEADPSEVGGFSSVPIGVYTEPAGWSANVIGRSA